MWAKWAKDLLLAWVFPAYEMVVVPSAPAAEAALLLVAMPG